jgi:PKD repeat protein
MPISVQDAGEAEDTATKLWTNAPPTIVIDTPSEGDLFDLTAGPVNLSATVTDPDAAEVLTCSVDWDDGSPPTTGISGASGTCTDSHIYTVAGVYTVSATVTDLLGLSDTDTVMIVVYDPTAGFVTGGGWIDSPAGAYIADPSLSGRASFGFVSKYHKGASTPSGSTEFQFRAGNLNFHSDSYQWLVVAGARAQYKGTGTINGESGYSFMLTAIDGALPGGGGSDRFRIKIWETATGTVVYDNQPGAPDGGDPTTTLGGGNIVIHK